METDTGKVRMGLAFLAGQSDFLRYHDRQNGAEPKGYGQGHEQDIVYEAKVCKLIG